MKKGVIAIKPAKFLASCNVCLARNFDATNFPVLGERVDMVFDVSIKNNGGMGFSFYLCKDCLRSFIGEAATALAAEGAEKV